MKKLFVLVLVFITASVLLSCTSNKADGKRFRFTDMTALDKKTGLMWTKDANMADKDMEWDDAVKFIEELNRGKYAGYSDWRLPAKDELVSFLSYPEYKSGGAYYLILYKNFGFKNVQAYGYWSSTTAAGDTAFAHDVFMCGGGMNAFSKTFKFHVWPVRAA